MEYVSKVTVFGLKMMKSGLEKYFETPPCALRNAIIHFQYYIFGFSYKNKNSVRKMTFCVHGGISKKKLWHMYSQ